jgi:hypothetical protein
MSSDSAQNRKYPNLIKLMDAPANDPPAEDPAPDPAPTSDPAPEPEPSSEPAPADPQPDPEPQPDPAPEPEPAPASDPPADDVQEGIAPLKKFAAGQKTPPGIHGYIYKAKGHGENAIQWAKENPTQAALIGAGVTIGTLLAGWTIWRVLGKKKRRNGGRQRRNHARSIDIADEIKAEFPATAMEKRALLDEIDFDDEEFLEFLELFPSAEDVDTELFAEALETAIADLA